MILVLALVDLRRRSLCMFGVFHREPSRSYLLANRFSQPPPTPRHQIISIISIPSHLHNLSSSSIHNCILDISVKITSTHQWLPYKIPKTCARHQSSREHNTVKILTLYPSGHAIRTTLMFPINQMTPKFQQFPNPLRRRINIRDRTQYLHTHHRIYTTFQNPMRGQNILIFQRCIDGNISLIQPMVLCSLYEGGYEVYIRLDSINFADGRGGESRDLVSFCRSDQSRHGSLLFFGILRSGGP